MHISEAQLKTEVAAITHEVIDQLKDGDAPTKASHIGTSAAEVARAIDHTLLKPDATAEQIARLCEEARDHHFASVCVNPTHVRLSAELLNDAPDVAVCTVIGFPLGASATGVKVYETLQAIADGATEVDMVINVGAMKSNNWKLVREDIARVTAAAHAGGAVCKVILETAMLTDDEKVKACQASVEAGADFVKTSTGFSAGGATESDIALMRRTVGPNIGVKASGGVRTYEDTVRMIEAGATRIGASAGVNIIREALGLEVDHIAPQGY